jgi:hypothetical protein
VLIVTPHDHHSYNSVRCWAHDHPTLLSKKGPTPAGAGLVTLLFKPIECYSGSMFRCWFRKESPTINKQPQTTPLSPLDGVGSISTLGSPLLLGHRSVADDVLAEHVLNVLCITPTFGITVLQPNKRRANIGRAMLGVVNNNGLFAPAGMKILTAS